MLGRRILTAAVLLPLALAGLFLASRQTWGLASAFVVAIGAWEWARLSSVGQAGRIVFAAFFLACCGAVLRLPASFEPLSPYAWAAALLFWLAAATPWVVKRWHVRSVPLLLATGWWVLFPAWLAAWTLQPQPGRLLVLMGTIWVADSAAYFAGRRFGRRKLAPLVSPGKSWEGVIGAIAGVAIYFVLVESLWPGLLSSGGSPAATLLFLEAVVALSIVGDLFESWMKREVGLKDSGSILPGHGGILDRLDSLTAALPVMALFVWWTMERAA
jgi:phosphatidate cytidylyltransferase